MSYESLKIGFKKYVKVFSSIVNLLESHPLQLGHSSCHLQHVTWLGKINPARKMHCIKIIKAGCSIPGNRILHLEKGGQNTGGGTGWEIWSISLKQETGQRNHPGHLMQMCHPVRPIVFIAPYLLTWEK